MFRRKRGRSLAGLLFASAFLFAASGAAGATVVFSASNPSQIETSQAVVNTALGFAHPKLQALDWDADGMAPYSSTAFEVGDGSDGPFNSEATYLRFHDGPYLGDKVIRINTDLHPELRFTVFFLANGWEIRPVGGNPLVIRSLTNITIEGLINCSGVDAGEADQNPDNTVTAAGGQGRCGGGNGGRGGSTLLAPTAGSASGANAAGPGSPGPLEGDGGGGGGGHSQNFPAPGDGVAFLGGAGGAAGSNLQDDAFTAFGGGAGGGGGAAYDAVADPANHSSGAGGGAGGGSVHLYAVGTVTVAATGEINVKGGAGGGQPGAGRGGAGGGGGGGSVLIFSRGDVVFDGPVNATGGAGGMSDGGDGGAGGDGRTWIIDSDGVAAGGVVENPTTLLAVAGNVTYRTGTSEIVSSLLDLGNSKPTITSVSADATVSGGSTVTLEIAGSSEPFDAASATWVPIAAASTLAHPRYVRLRATIDNQDASSPAILRSVTVEFARGTESEFNFVGGCGSMGGPSPAHPGALLFLLCLPLAVALRLRFAQN